MSKTVYVMTCFEKMSVEDSYNEGEIGTENCFGMNISVEDEDLKKCVEKAFNFLGLDYDENDMYVPDDGQYVEISRFEDDDADPASESQVEKWKKGQERIWSCRYYWKVVKRTEEDVDLRKEINIA